MDVRLCKSALNYLITISKRPKENSPQHTKTRSGFVTTPRHPDPWEVSLKVRKSIWCFVFFFLLFLSRPWLWIAIHCYSHRTDSEPSVTISAHKNTHQHAQTMDSGAFLGDSQGRARPWRIESHLPNKMRVNRERKWFIVIFSFFFFSSHLICISALNKEAYAQHICMWKDIMRAGLSLWPALLHLLS